MYLETMEKVLADINKIIIDKKSGGGVVPYLPLLSLKKYKRKINERKNIKIFSTYSFSLRIFDLLDIFYSV